MGSSLIERAWRRGPPLLVGLVGMACADPPAAEPTFDPALASALQAAVDDAVLRIGAPGASVTVILRSGATWSGTAGLADVAAGRAVEVGDLFRVGSVTKLYVAAVVEQLVSEGTLGLDEPLAAWVPGAPSAAVITVGQLLAHTSGLPDHVSDPEFLAGLDQEWSADELVALVADEPLLFEPGTAYAYSNTGYVLLGQVIAAATGRAWAEEVRARLLEPLGLEATWAPSLGETPAIVRGYGGVAPDWVDITEGMNPTAPNAAGELVATASDVARFGAALLVDGESTDTRGLADLLEPVTLPDGSVSPHALGPEITPRGEDLLVGHSGSTMGFQSRVHALIGEGIVAATLVNGLFAEADVVDASLWDVLDP